MKLRNPVIPHNFGKKKVEEITISSKPCLICHKMCEGYGTFAEGVVCSRRCNGIHEETRPKMIDFQPKENLK